MITPNEHDWTLARFVSEAVLYDFVAHLEDDTNDAFDFTAHTKQHCTALARCPDDWADQHVSNFDFAGNDGSPDRRDDFADAWDGGVLLKCGSPFIFAVMQCIIEEVLERGLMCSSEDIERADEQGKHPLYAVACGGFA